MRPFDGKKLLLGELGEGRAALVFVEGMRAPQLLERFGERLVDDVANSAAAGAFVAAFGLDAAFVANDAGDDGRGVAFLAANDAFQALVVEPLLVLVGSLSFEETAVTLEFVFQAIEAESVLDFVFFVFVDALAREFDEGADPGFGITFTAVDTLDLADEA